MTDTNYFVKIEVLVDAESSEHAIDIIERSINVQGSETILDIRVGVPQPGAGDVFDSTDLYCDREARSYREALKNVRKLFDEVLPKVNYGASFFSASHIKLLNEVPPLVRQVLDKPVGE